jgi:hypothetical protein
MAVQIDAIDPQRAFAQSSVRLPPASQVIGTIRRGRDGQLELMPGARAPAQRRRGGSIEPEPDLPEASNLPESGWIADARTGCQVWNTDPRPGETITWSGACAGGRATGPGILQWFENGHPMVRVEAEFRDGQSLGRGTFAWPDGARYSGEYSHSGWHGHGTFVWADGERYEGEWREGAQNGRGVYIWPDGGRYDGEWRDGQRHGRGVHVWADGTRYEGEWDEDVPHGQGTFTARRGVYAGTWTAGCFRSGPRRVAIGVDTTLAACP